MEDEIITWQEFVIRCHRNERFIGHILGIGYVSAWRTERIDTERPLNNPKAYVGNAHFIETVDVPVIISILDSNYRNNIPNQKSSNYKYNEFSEKGRATSWGGLATTGGTMVDFAIIKEPYYLKINPQGTVIRNPNFGKTKVGTKGVSSRIGWVLLLLSAGYDVAAFFNDEISLKEMEVDIVANGVIFGAGYFCPHLGVILGLLYMSFTASSPGYHPSYEDIHRNTMPADKTIFVIPHKPLPIPYVYDRPTPVFKQGK